MKYYTASQYKDLDSLVDYIGKQATGKERETIMEIAKGLRAQGFSTDDTLAKMNILADVLRGGESDEIPEWEANRSVGIKFVRVKKKEDE